MKRRTPRIADFYKRHYAKHLGIALILQLLVVLFICNSVWFLYSQGVVTGIGLIVLIGITFLLVESGVIILTLRLYGEPLQIISKAVAHVSTQNRETPPPNVNSQAYERTGLKDLVQTIYKLSVASFQPTGQGEFTAQEQALLRSVLAQLPCELVVLDNNQNITFYHGDGGLAKMPGGSVELSLRFSPLSAFQDWLEDCQRNKVREHSFWKRVPNAVLGSTDERKVYDVFAHYEKSENSLVETVLVLVDRTEDYARDEDNMDFIALAAHELRGPITVIRGYIDVLGDELGEKLDEDQKQLLARMQVSSERLSGYINNILNVSRYDRAHLKLNLSEETIGNILNSVMDDVKLRAWTQNRQLTFQIPENLPSVAADSSSFSEVIVNLIDNAIKYSHDGGEVTVTAAMEGDFVQITVTDQGVGMPDNVVSQLFNKFYRSHRSRQSVGGTGLGLYISKAIMESHGGKIWARSKENEGSTFGVMIPTYASVAEKLKAGDNGNENVIEGSHGWIKNHSMYRG